MHSKSGIVNGLFPDRNRLVVIKVYPLPDAFIEKIRQTGNSKSL